MNRGFKIIGNTVFYFLLVGLFIVSMMFWNAKRFGKQPSIFGYKAFVVLTGSMTPNINIGDLLVIKEVDLKEINVEDVITFKSENSNNITTHRVKKILNEDDIQFITKGDANNIEDIKPVKGELVLGKCVKNIPKVGSVFKFIQSNITKVITSIMVIASIIIIFF